MSHSNDMNGVVPTDSNVVVPVDDAILLLEFSKPPIVFPSAVTRSVFITPVLKRLHLQSFSTREIYDCVVGVYLTILFSLARWSESHSLETLTQWHLSIKLFVQYMILSPDQLVLDHSTGILLHRALGKLLTANSLSNFTFEVKNAFGGAPSQNSLGWLYMAQACNTAVIDMGLSQHHLECFQLQWPDHVFVAQFDVSKSRLFNLALGACFSTDESNNLQAQ